MDKEKTYYDVLDVPADASPAEIRSAFRLLQSIDDTDSLSTYSLFSGPGAGPSYSRLNRPFQP